jgi:hypothetical protein
MIIFLDLATLLRECLNHFRNITTQFTQSHALGRNNIIILLAQKRGPDLRTFLQKNSPAFPFQYDPAGIQDHSLTRHGIKANDSDGDLVLKGFDTPPRENIHQGLPDAVQGIRSGFEWNGPRPLIHQKHYKSENP